MEWPPTAEALDQLPQVENALVEYKREWHDLGGKQGKAEFIKDVLALANVVRRDEPGYLFIGIEDQKEGREIVGIEESPSVEQLHQILAAYSNPVPDVDYSLVPVGDRHVAAIRINYTDAQPYYSIRDYNGILDSRLVYARRGPTIGVLRPAEVEALFRSRGGNADIDANHPVQAGFVEDGQDRGKLILRIVNITETPLAGISVIWDMEQVEHAFFHRVRSLANLGLKPGEAFEDEFEPSAYHELMAGTAAVTPAFGWLNLTAWVQYRDRSGFIRQIERRIAVEMSPAG